MTQPEPKGEGRGDELGMGRLGVLLEQGGQALGAVPPVQGAAQVLRPAQVTEPDTALGGELAQVGAAVGGEGEGDPVFPGPAVVLFREQGLGGWLEASAVTFGLLEVTGDVGVLALGLGCGERREPDEQAIVGGAALGGPLGDGEVLALLGAGSRGVTDALRVRDPSCLAQLLVDQLAGLRLVELDGGRGLVCGPDDLVDGARGLGACLRLAILEALLERGPALLGLRGHLLPKCLLVGRGAELRLDGLQASDGLQVLRLVLGECER